MQDWNDFQYLLALEEGGTMKQAAVLLGTNPTTVSRHIKRISNLLGVTLFTMNKGGAWTITDHGLKLTTIAKDFKHNISAVDLHAPDTSGPNTIKISSLDFLLTHYLAPHLESGAACYPNTALALLGTDKRVSLAYGEADLALRFARPTEGQLIASLIAEIEFYIWTKPGFDSQDWIGLQEEVDWTPEMQFGRRIFKRPPLFRVTTFDAAKHAAHSLQLPFIGPKAILNTEDDFVPMKDVKPISRQLWSVIHESKRHSRRLSAVRNWAKQAITQSQNAQV